MKVLVAGAGAIGGYVGGSLSLCGHEVVFYCREATARALQTGGLVLGLPDGERYTQVRTAVEPGAAFAGEPFDFTLITLKVYDTEAALAPLSSFGGRMGPLVCLQNGVEAEGMLEKVFPGVEVISGTVTTAVGRPEKNRVVVEKLRGLGLAGSGPLVDGIAAALDRAGLNARIYADARSMKWSKLLTNLTANPLCAILDMKPAEIYSHPRLFDLEMRQLNEALAVMAKIDAAVTNLPGTPVVPLAFIAKYMPREIARWILGRALAKGRGEKMPSFHVDLHSGGTKTEAPYLQGAVVRFGKRLGVPTPVNRAFVETVKALFEKRIPVDEYSRQPEKFLQAVASL